MNERFLSMMVPNEKSPSNIFKENVPYSLCNSIVLVNNQSFLLVVSLLLMNILILFLGRPTEIAENDVYICEAKYVPADHSLRNLNKGLKVKALERKNPSSNIL